MLVTRPYLNQERLLDPNTLLLLHFDGSNNSTSFVDSSQYNRAITVNGAAKITTAQSVFGGSSGDFFSVGNSINVANSADFNVGTGDWTLEYWVYNSSTISGASTWLFGNNTTGWTTGAFGVVQESSWTNFISNGLANFGASMTNNAWSHVAWCRSGNIIRLFINGVLRNTNNSTGQSYQFNLGSNNMAIGRNWDNIGLGKMYIDEFRISNVARYTANFTPSNAPFNP
jgi:hypothetical protein